jgi:sec-independent protein translocase protein TatA
MTTLFAWLNFGMQEMVILLIIGVVIFGRKLPEVGRYLGKGIVEFKKGIRGIEDDVDLSGSSQTTNAQVEQPKAPQKVAPSAPKFEDFGSQDNSQKV